MHLVWDEAFRVLRPGGTQLAGFNNPIFYVSTRTCLVRQTLQRPVHPSSLFFQPAPAGQDPLTARPLRAFTHVYHANGVAFSGAPQYKIAIQLLYADEYPEFAPYGPTEPEKS